MSIIDFFMSKVIDLDEKEKEETILFLAESLINDNYEFLKKISPKVQNVVLPFLTSVAVKGNEEKMGGVDEYFYEATSKDPHLKKVYFKEGGEKDV